MNQKVYDIAIVGAGIVGLATALHLSERSKLKVIVIEAEDEIAKHQTGNNSGVIHSGLYYKPGSSKALNCVKGREALYKFCRENNIKHERCGKLVVAVSENERAGLEKLYQTGLANNLKGLKKLSAAEIFEYEPHIRSGWALHVPDTGIVNYKDVCRVYLKLIQNSDNDILLNSKFLGIHKDQAHLVIGTVQKEIRAKNLINCAGLYSDRVAKKCGIKTNVRIVPFRGEYYELVPEKKHLINNLVYPVPNPDFPFLGVHFTRMIDGGVEAGPNAVLAFKRTGYKRSDFNIKDFLEVMTYPGFWILASKYWYTGFGEFYRSYSKKAFVSALQKLLPELNEEDVREAGAGVRAQALSSNGKLVDDFKIEQTKNMIHVLNAPSPAATASLAIGETIAGMAKVNFDLQGI